jgi:hypothetical protein
MCDGGHLSLIRIDEVLTSIEEVVVPVKIMDTLWELLIILGKCCIELKRAHTSVPHRNFILIKRQKRQQTT